MLATEYQIDTASGLIEPARQCLSPNQDDRPQKEDPRLIVIHGISLPPGEYGGPQIEQLFCNTLDWNEHAFFNEIRGIEVSSHLLIRRDGSVLQFVPFTQRAWHAGQSKYRGVSACNDFSIGIELEGCDDSAYENAQYQTLNQVIKALIRTYPGLDARAVAGHCDIAPGRKTDPGPAFDWLRLYDDIAPQETGTK